MDNATLFREFLEACSSFDEFNGLLDVALEECAAADLAMSKTGRIWLMFRDGSDCFLALPKEGGAE